MASGMLRGIPDFRKMEDEMKMILVRFGVSFFLHHATDCSEVEFVIDPKKNKFKWRISVLSYWSRVASLCQFQF